uniref:CSON004398 protein n=1 Tax=Culicoides sonorensis TaxID=179676 RepID=A0A336KDJ6_CULSO
MEKDKEESENSDSKLKANENCNTEIDMASDKPNTDTSDPILDLGDDFMVIDEVTGSQDTDPLPEEMETRPEVIDLDKSDSTTENVVKDEIESTKSQASDFLGFDIKETENELSDKPGKNIGRAPSKSPPHLDRNETINDDGDVDMRVSPAPLDKVNSEDLLKIPTPPPLDVPGDFKKEDIGSDLASQIQAALEKAKNQIENSGSNFENKTELKKDDVVELLDDDEDEKMSEDVPKNNLNGTTSEKAQISTIECINPQCDKTSNDFIRARKFIINHFRQNGEKLNKKQFVCSPCYDIAIEKYRSYSQALLNQQPLLKMEMPHREEVVELLSDGEDSDKEENSDEEIISKDVQDLLSNELEDVIAKTLAKVNIDKQISWSLQIIKTRTNNNQAMLDENEADIVALERKANLMYRRLYGVNEVQYHNVPTLEILSTSDGQFYKEKYQLPSIGPVVRPQINLSSIYFAVKQRLLSTWCQCKVIDVIEVEPNSHHFRVQFIDSKINNIRVVSPKQIAYGHPPTSRLHPGERVIALFDTKTHGTQSHIPGTIGLPRQFYPGIIAEPLQQYNQFRYLIFFDDGYAQYVTPQDVRLVHDVSDKVWEDVHPHSKEFVENYLQNFKKERPMVQAQKNQRIITEYKGRWQPARVVDVDASLVRVYFQDAKKTEWIYRGSTRLAPLFKQKGLHQTTQPQQRTQKRIDPSIEYVQIGEGTETSRPKTQEGSSQPRAVARKSSAGARPKTNFNVPQTTEQRQQQLQQQRQEQREKIKFMNRNTIILDDDLEKGRVVYYTAKQNHAEKKFTPHECNPNCLFKIAHNLKNYSPTSKPLLSGWERQIVKQKQRRIVFYRAPCGRRLRDTDEIYQYLKMTNCRLGIECFDYDDKLHCLAEYVTEKAYLTIPDISNGLEGMPIPCVNSYDETKPPACEYSANRIPTEGVNLVTDSEFMCGCDCTNDCIDKSTCACQQLTIQGARFTNPNILPERVGYIYKRLYDQINGGIYECNPNCKCSKKSCLNRVVQHPISNKLQLFKTHNMGWGLRATTDIPKGTFICIYAGYLLTDEKANTDHGDEYFADLDYIELVEQIKNGYESDAHEMTDESDYEPEEDGTEGDREFVPSGGRSSSNSRATRSTRSSKSVEQLMERAHLKEGAKKDNKNKDSRPASRSGSDDEDTREKISLVPNSNPDDCETVRNSKYRSLRELYGENESVYVMDAKICGNIGRYFNHSCDPNIGLNKAGSLSSLLFSGSNSFSEKFWNSFPP